jgi:hypothetical protein
MRGPRSCSLSVERFEDRDLPSPMGFPDRGPEPPPYSNPVEVRGHEAMQPHVPNVGWGNANQFYDSRLTAMDVDRSVTDLVVTHFTVTLTPGITTSNAIPSPVTERTPFVVSPYREVAINRQLATMSASFSPPPAGPVEPHAINAASSELQRNAGNGTANAAIALPVATVNSAAPAAAFPIVGGFAADAGDDPQRFIPGDALPLVPPPRVALPSVIPSEFDPLDLDFPAVAPLAGALGVDLVAVEENARSLLNHISDAAVEMPADENLLETYGWSTGAAIFAGWAAHALWTNRKPRRPVPHLAARGTLLFPQEGGT